MDNPLDNSGVVDSRDVIEYFNELENLVTSHKEQLDEWENEGGTRPDTDAEELAELEQELEKLQEFMGECENYNSDFGHGVQLIPEDEFTQYTEELVKDIGDLPRDLPAYLVIDWEATAENLKVDYTEVDYRGNSYLILNT